MATYAWQEQHMAHTTTSFLFLSMLYCVRFLSFHGRAPFYTQCESSSPPPTPPLHHHSEMSLIIELSFTYFKRDSRQLNIFPLKAWQIYVRAQKSRDTTWHGLNKRRMRSPESRTLVFNLDTLLP